jgi:uncharacterized membrane protein
MNCHSSAFDNELMLFCMHSVLQFFQRLRGFALNLPDHNRRTTIDLRNNIMNHETCSIMLQFAFVVIVVGSFYGINAIVFAWERCLILRKQIWEIWASLLTRVEVDNRYFLLCQWIQNFGDRTCIHPAHITMSGESAITISARSASYFSRAACLMAWSVSPFE